MLLSSRSIRATFALDEFPPDSEEEFGSERTAMSMRGSALARGDLEAGMVHPGGGAQGEELQDRRGTPEAAPMERKRSGACLLQGILVVQSLTCAEFHRSATVK